MNFTKQEFLSYCGSIFIVLSLLSPGTVLADGTTEAEDPVFRQLVDYAYMADVAYRDEQDIRQLMTAKGYELTSYGNLPGYSVSYFVATNEADKHQIIAVRGTSNIENALVDVAFKLIPDKSTDISLHQGFARSADYLFETVKPVPRKDYVIDTTGHSLGGATALVLAMYLDAYGYQVGKVITFGQPKVTNIMGSRKYAHLDVTRVVMPKDMVPLVPPVDPLDLMNLDIYWHQGKEIVLLKDNTYAVLEGMDSMLRATDFFNDIPNPDNLQNHFMSNYIASLEQKLVQPQQVPYVNDFSISDLFGSSSTGNGR